MVGRVLPNSRPSGEDHRGAVGEERTGTLRRTHSGEVSPEYVSWIRTKMTIRTLRA
jgi:hypothetical protein